MYILRSEVLGYQGRPFKILGPNLRSPKHPNDRVTFLSFEWYDPGVEGWGVDYPKIKKNKINPVTFKN